MSAKKVPLKILLRLILVIKTKIKIINKLGLHARASSKLTELANKFKNNFRGESCHAYKSHIFKGK